MKVHRYSEHQRQMWVYEMVHKTKTIKAICAEASISRATLYNWLSEVNEAKMESGDAQTGHTSATTPAAWQPTDKYKMLLSALVKTDTDKSISRRLARELVKRYNLTTAQACGMVNLPEEAYGYRPRKPETDDREVYAALVNALEEQTSRSLEDCIALLQVAYPAWAIKQIKRVYRQGRLYLKRTRIRRVQQLPTHIAIPVAKTNAPLFLQREGAFWHLGVIVQPLFWMLFLLDYNDGMPLNITTGEGDISEADIMLFIKKAAGENALPKKIRIPSEAPFTSRELSKWCWENRVAIYNLSMQKPENILEADYIKTDICRQLTITEETHLSSIQSIAATWVAGFAASSLAAIPLFAKETVAG